MCADQRFLKPRTALPRRRTLPVCVVVALLGDPAFLIALISASGEGRRPACGETQRRSIAAITCTAERESARARRERERETVNGSNTPHICPRRDADAHGGAGRARVQSSSVRHARGKGERKRGKRPKRPKRSLIRFFLLAWVGRGRKPPKPPKIAPHRMAQSSAISQVEAPLYSSNSGPIQPTQSSIR